MSLRKILIKMTAHSVVSAILSALGNSLGAALFNYVNTNNENYVEHDVLESAAIASTGAALLSLALNAIPQFDLYEDGELNLLRLRIAFVVLQLLGPIIGRSQLFPSSSTSYESIEADAVLGMALEVLPVFEIVNCIYTRALIRREQQHAAIPDNFFALPNDEENPGLVAERIVPASNNAENFRLPNQEEKAVTLVSPETPPNNSFQFR